MIRAMSRELLILRHAKSAWDTGAPTDFERPLNKRGRKAAPRVGRFLQTEGLVPDYVISSPAERARQTVTLVCEQMGISPEALHWDQRIYGGGTRALIEVLRESPAEARRVLIAGHNPGLEILLLELCGHRIEAPLDGKLMPTAAVAQLEIVRPWADLEPRSGKLVSLTRARSLKEY